jgi:hypothetical protein
LPCSRDCLSICSPRFGFRCAVFLSAPAHDDRHGVIVPERAQSSLREADFVEAPQADLPVQFFAPFAYF